MNAGFTLMLGMASLNALPSKFELHQQLHSGEIKKMLPQVPSCTLNDSASDGSFAYGQQCCTKESTKTSLCKLLDHVFVLT